LSGSIEKCSNGGGAVTHRVAIVGLDGATWGNLRRWTDQGELPLFKRLVEQGVATHLLSTVPPFTIPAWNVMTSGRSPADIGCFSTIQKVPGEYRWQPYYLIHDGPAELWDYANSAGIETLVMNFPNVHHPYEIRGLVTVGWLFNDPTLLTYPVALKHELDRLVGGYELDPGDPQGFTGGDTEFLDAVKRVNAKHCAAMAALLRKTRFPLAMMALVGPDRSQPRFWFQQELVLEQYRELEAGLELILEALGEEYNVLFVSDHGFGPAQRRIRLNQWLVDHGYLVLKQSPGRLRGMAVDVLKKAGLEPALRQLARAAPQKFGRALTKRFEPVRWEELPLDWARTTAFNDSDWGYIYFNVKGRDPQGIVEPEECERLGEEIAAGLGDIRDPLTGERLGGRVRRKEEIYSGQYIDEAPDLVVDMDDRMPAFISKVGYSNCVAQERWASHRREGLFLGWGPDMTTGAGETPVEMVDVAPTVLHLLGLPIPSDMEGEVRLDLLAPSARRPVERGSPLPSPRRSVPPPAESDLVRRLRAVGYLE
jgi:predicted AlkP superfamily phosphohydrolase/phosphomutase